jgi:hypothetical protein
MPFWPLRKPKKPPPDPSPYFWRKKSPFGAYERLTREEGRGVADGDAQARKHEESWQRESESEPASFKFVAGELYCVTSDPAYNPNAFREERYLPDSAFGNEAKLLKRIEVLGHIEEGKGRPHPGALLKKLSRDR